MLSSGANQGFFCVRTSHKNGLHFEVIKRDDDVISRIVFKCTRYFHLVVLRTLFKKYLLVTGSEKPTSSVCVQNSDVRVTDFDTAHNVSVVAIDNCPTCKVICISNPKTHEQMSIECSICKCWYHLVCADLKGNENCVTKSKVSWNCKTCSRES